MDKFCSCNQPPRAERRLNGLQLPLHVQQIIGWFVLALTAIVNGVILIQIQFFELKIASAVVYIILYTKHIIFHLLALFLDPGENDLRKSNDYSVPEFDRNIHAHVIENGRCHLCNIHTSSNKTKHCSICNKCVDRFDHHCKWLNNCIGHRNYRFFLMTVITSTLISAFTMILCICDIIFYASYVELLSPIAQNYISCKNQNLEKSCVNSIMFVAFLVILCVISFSITCALLHLCCFHVYINFIGVSTYEYTTNFNYSRDRSCLNNILCCNGLFSKNKRKNESEVSTDNGPLKIKTDHLNSNSRNMAFFINSLVNEVSRARRYVFYDNNKISPSNIDTNYEQDERNKSI